MLKIRIEDIDKLEKDVLLETLIKVIDAAKEAGVAFGLVDANPIAAISRPVSRSHTRSVLSRGDENTRESSGPKHA